MAVVVTDGSGIGASYATVANGSVQATGPQTADTAGFQMLGSEVNQAGGGVGRVVKEIEASEDYRIRSGTDAKLFDERMLGSAVSSGLMLSAVTTQTVSVGAGALTLNASAITTLSTVSRVTTQQCFTPANGAPLYGQFEYVYPPAAPVANSEFEAGFVIHTGTAVPTDGAFLRYTTTGTVECVICHNSSETSAVITAPTGLVRHRVVISVYDDSANFWIDDVLVASIATPTGRGTPWSAGGVPLSFRLRNAAVAPGTAVSPQIFAAGAYLGDVAVQARSAEECAVLGGGMACQGQAGATQGSLANWANSAAPASATLSNTAAGYTTLGGQWQFAAVAGAETDYALFGFQVPVAAALAHGKKLVITGVRIDSINTVVAVATTATVLQWGIAVGATAVSLATAESATAKSPRRVPLGIQTFAVGAGVGAAAVPINAVLGSPMVAMPGEFVHVILKMPIGTATATEIFRGTVGVDGYWE